MPFNGRTDEEILKSVQKDPIDFTQNKLRNVSFEATDLLKKILERDINKRLTA